MFREECLGDRETPVVRREKYSSVAEAPNGYRKVLTAIRFS